VSGRDKKQMSTFVPNVRYQGRPSKAEMQRRWSLASEAMKAENIDCLIMQANDPIMGGYVKWFCEVQTIHICTALFDSDCNISFIGHGPKGSAALGPMYEIELANNIAVPAFHNAVYADRFVSEEIIKIVKKNGYRKIGFVAENLISAALYKNLVNNLPEVEFVNATDMVDHLVAVKSPEQLEALKRTVELHDAVASAMVSLLRPGRMEREVCADLYKICSNLGADEFLNNIMIGSVPLAGPMYQMHYQNKIIEKGDAITLLLEVNNLEGYYGELTRVWTIGEPDPELVEVMAQAVECQDYIASIAKPGVKGRELFNALNEWLGERGYPPEKRLFGHGQGYNLVERPYFDAYEEMELKENMFISIHPTLSTKSGISVYPCDNFVVTTDGAKILNKFPRTVIPCLIF